MSCAHIAGAVVVERPADVEDGYSLTAPLVYHFGHKSPDANTPLYNLLVSQLAEIINLRSEANNKSMTCCCCCFPSF